MDDINVEAAFDAVARSALRRGEQDDDLYVTVKFSFATDYVKPLRVATCPYVRIADCLYAVRCSVPRDTVEINRTPVDSQCAC